MGDLIFTTATRVADDGETELTYTMKILGDPSPEQVAEVSGMLKMWIGGNVASIRRLLETQSVNA
jgi:hypothetical protein